MPLKEGTEQKRVMVQFAAMNGSPCRRGWKGAKRMLGDGPHSLPAG